MRVNNWVNFFALTTFCAVAAIADHGGDGKGNNNDGNVNSAFASKRNRFDAREHSRRVASGVHRGLPARVRPRFPAMGAFTWECRGC